MEVRAEVVGGVRVIRPRWSPEDALDALCDPRRPAGDEYDPLEPTVLLRESQRLEERLRRVRSGQTRWDGGTLAEVRALLRDGWAEEVGKLVVKPHVGSGEVRKAVKVRAPVGGLVDYQRWQAGRPDFMVGKRMQNKSRPVIRIGVDKAAPWTVEADTILAVGRTVHTVVASLRARGFPTEVWACSASAPTYSKEAQALGQSAVCDARVLIVPSNRPITGARLAYWLAHPSVLRRAIFALRETLPTYERRLFGFHQGGGYGKSIPDYAKPDFSEWAPSPANGKRAAEMWAAEVLGRRV